MPLSDLERRVCEHIESRAAELYANLDTCVMIPTGRDHVAGLDLYRKMLATRLGALGAKIEQRPGQARPDWMRLPGTRDESNAVHPILIATHAPGGGKKSAGDRESRGDKAGGRPRILLAGHLDTVHDPHGEFQRLTPLPDGVCATGPGAADMKGGIEVGVAALESLHHCGVELPWTVILNSDEETGSFQSEQHLRDLAKQHDVGVALEPALPGGALAIERMGSGQFRIDVFGRSAHVGRDFTNGVSAVHRLAQIIVALDSLSKPESGMIVNVGPLQGGKATNVVADHAACWGNVRFTTPDAGEALAKAIDALATSPDAMPRVEVRRAWARPAKPLTPEVERLAIGLRAVAADLGQELPFAKTGGVCDGNILQDAGLPTLDTLGVRGGNLHRIDEFIEIPSLVERAKLLAVWLMRLGGLSDC